MSDCTQIEDYLIDYLDEALEATEINLVNTHIATCAACKEKLTAFRSIGEAYRESTGTDVCDEIASKILVRANQEIEVTKPFRTGRWLLAMAAIVIAYIAIAKGPNETEPERDQVVELLMDAERYLASGEFESAHFSLDEAARLSSEGEHNASIHHQRAEVFVMQDQLALAFEQLEQFTSEYPEYSERKAALLLRGEVLERQGMFGHAIQAYHLVAHEYPADKPEVDQRLQRMETATGEDKLGGTESLEALGYVGD